MNDNQRLDRICGKIKSAETLNALHACRDGHPLNRGNDCCWRNASAMVWGKVCLSDIKWLADKAEDERLLQIADENYRAKIMA